MNFAAAIKEAMDAKEMSRADLARATGRSYQYISDLLKGERRWHEQIINEVCAALEIQIEIKSVAETDKEVSDERSDAFDQPTDHYSRDQQLQTDRGTVGI